HVAEQGEEEELLDRDLRRDLGAEQPRRRAAVEHTEPDADEVPDEEERDADHHDERGTPGSSPEEQGELPVEHGHPDQGEHETGEVDAVHQPACRSSGSGSGSVEVSPWIRLSSTSALMRHIGSPMPGIVDAPTW